MTDTTEDNSHEAIYDSAHSKFESNLIASDTYFYHRQMPAWIVNPDAKWIAPITRLYLGNEQGSEIFFRFVNFGCSINLADDLLATAVGQAEALQKMDGFFVFVPEKREFYIALMKSIEENMSKLTNLINDLDIRNTITSQHAPSVETED